MLRGKLRALFVTATMLASAPMLMGAQGRTNDFQGRILAAHNQEREELGEAPLRWDASLAADAQRWADYLARSGKFQHAPDGDGPPEGENLWSGTKGYYSLEAMVGLWIDEKRDFKPGVFPDNSTTGNVEDVGHFTQVAWRSTHQVGCALASGSREEILVCRYSQAGNYVGERPF